MKILFIADIHIKLGQKNVPVEWSKNRYKLLCKQLETMQKEADVLVIGGDIFDKTPSLEELEIYFYMLDSISIDCFVYPGNHEALKKTTTFFTYLKDVTRRLNPLVKVIDDFYTYQGIDFIPYNKLREPWPDSLNSKILCTHVRGEIPPHVKPEFELDKFLKWPVVLAGDLHSYENSQANILYPGSPVTTSFHRHEVKTGAILLDTETLEHTWLEFKLPQLLKRTVTSEEDIVATSYHHTIYEVEGTLKDLGSMQDNKLVSKRVVKRESDTQLILDPKMTMAQEVSEYLQYILLLEGTELEEALTEMNNYV